MQRCKLRHLLKDRRDSTLRHLLLRSGKRAGYEQGAGAEAETDSEAHWAVKLESVA